ncbi:MAG: putative bifunctional diguanylate cyclase/phosphodiesterase [Halioglobus sp.]
MQIAGKITALFLVTAIVAGVILADRTLSKEYAAARLAWTERAVAEVAARPTLQIGVYSSDLRNLHRAMEAFLKPGFLGDEVSVAAIYNSSGSKMLQRDPQGLSKVSLPPLPQLRGAVGVAEPAVGVFDKIGKESVPSARRTLLGEPGTLHLSVPILSLVNPAQPGLGRADFAAAISNPSDNSSKVVMGYLQLLQSERPLVMSALSATLELLMLFGLLMLGCAALLYLALRQITAPLSQLRRVAREVIDGETPEPLELNAGADTGEIVEGFNKLIDGVNSYQKEIEVDRRLLSLKVDESASKLSQRDEELSRATEEITEANERLHRLAYYDSLTSLPNKTLFAEQLRLLLPMSVRSGQPLALLFLSLNQFKRINTTLGRRASDALLKEVAKRLTGCLRSSDVVGQYDAAGPRIDVSRLGGDEFSLVLNQLDGRESARVVAQRVVDSLRTPFEIEGHELVVTPSIGIAVAPDDGSEVDDLMRAAGSAMHHARDKPAGGFEMYKKDMDTGGLDQIKLEADLRKAVEREELRLHYQPQVDTVDGSIIAAEALLRWEHPEFGQVPPFRFISLAQDIGMMDQLGDWVLREACRQLASFRADGLELPRVAVNVSRLQFGERFTKTLKNVLAQSGLPAQSIELGLSEEILIDNDTTTIRSLRELAEMGVYLAVDNFGTTHAPLTYLNEYPFNELKIDRSFVSGCNTQTSDASLVKAIVAMSNSLQLSAVAEGVETEEEFRFLSGLGVRAMQGYFFSKPVPADELQKLLGIPWCFMSQIQRIKFADSQQQSSQ